MLADIQRRRSRRGLPSRPQPLVFPQLGQSAIDGEYLPPEPPVDLEDVQAQPKRIADIFVYGPMMIFSGLGQRPPRWARVGMIILGVGTIVYGLYSYFEIEKRKIRAGTANGPLGQLNWGPMHRADPDLHRPTVITRALYRR